MTMSDKCDKEVYENGSQIFLTHSIPAKKIEKWIKAVAKESGQKVDWHYVGGRAVILALGDLKKVYSALTNLRETHDDLYFHAVKELGDTFTDKMIQEQLQGIWEYNDLK